jgi:hypothetical protein
MLIHIFCDYILRNQLRYSYPKIDFTEIDFNLSASCLKAPFDYSRLNDIQFLIIQAEKIYNNRLNFANSEMILPFLKVFSEKSFPILILGLFPPSFYWKNFAIPLGTDNQFIDNGLLFLQFPYWYSEISTLSQDLPSGTQFKRKDWKPFFTKGRFVHDMRHIINKWENHNTYRFQHEIIDYYKKRLNNFT